MWSHESANGSESVDLQPYLTSRSITSGSYFSGQSSLSVHNAQTSAGTASRPSTTRPSTGRRSRGPGSVYFGEAQRVICAVSEGRGVSPTVGLAFMNISTVNKVQISEPTEILLISTSAHSNVVSKLHSIVEENVHGSKLVSVDRRYWSETAGLAYIQQYAFSEDVEALKVAIEGNYFATCCLAAVLKYIENCYEYTFAPHSLRIKYQASEGSMMIDLSTIQSLELLQNSQNSKSKECLFGLLRHTFTPMGTRLLRSNILQPSTQKDMVLSLRYDAVQELTVKEEMFFAVRQALKSQLDVDKLLTKLIIFPINPDIQYAEQSINDILIMKTFLQSNNAVHESLSGARSDLLSRIRQLCRAEIVNPVMKMINDVINEDVTYQSKPLDLRNQRTYAVKSGVSGLLDVARQTYKEVTEDIHRYVDQLNEEQDLHAELKFDRGRRYYFKIVESQLQECQSADLFINRYRKRNYIECQTLYLMKLNQRLEDSHQEVILMSDKTVQQLLDKVRGEIQVLFKIGEGIALLDMLASFAHVAIINDYVRPELTDFVGIKAGRHPMREKMHKEKFIPNDVYASDQARFQIITGCNMSGKSTYIRTIALITVMAQIGSFVPATYASLRIIHQLFARVSVDDCNEANVSTFAAEMRETAYILRNIDKNSLAVIDELGRGTSTRDGLAIALSIAETLVDSGALVWFVTHFRELAQIMAERNGVVNLHLAVEMSDASAIKMLYKITDGLVQEENYGIALARVINLPADVIAVAEKVSSHLRAQVMAKKRSSKARVTARKRKLLLTLREHLLAVKDGAMAGKTLINWLSHLQREFVTRMEAIDEEAAAESHDEDDVGEEKGYGHEDEDMQGSEEGDQPEVMSISDDVDESSEAKDDMDVDDQDEHFAEECEN